QEIRFLIGPIVYNHARSCHRRHPRLSVLAGESARRNAHAQLGILLSINWRSIMSSASIRKSWRWLGILVCLFIVAAGQAQGASSSKVYVVLWFDTEDYILPASDDAALKIADFLTGEKVRATFKV